MASEVPSVKTPASSLVQGSHATQVILLNKSGNALPQNGNAAAALPANQSFAPPPTASTSATASAKATHTTAKPTAAAQASEKASIAAQTAALNKALNDSGSPAKFRASKDDKQIEEVNPSNGEVVAVYPAEEFAELARSVGITGALVDELV